MRTEDEFARCFEWEDDDKRQPSGWAAAAGVCFALLIGSGLFLWHRRNRLAGLIMLIGLGFCVGCQSARNAPKVKTQQHNSKPKGLGWQEHDSYNESVTPRPTTR